MGAFIAGVVRGARPSAPSSAHAFADAWEQQDFAAMHDQLTPEAAERYPLPTFTDDYGRAQDLATVESVDTSEVHSGETATGEVAVIPVRLNTHAFGPLGGDVQLPIEDGKVAWQPHLVFPGLDPGEHLDRRARLPKRAPILAADGTPLAQGAASARSSPLGAAAADVAGQMGTPPLEREAALERLGFPPGTPVGTSGLELAFDARLAGQPGGQLLAVASGRSTRAGSGRVLASNAPEPGQPVHTTIDPGLQQAAVTALAGRLGGVAVLDARHGSVLALAGLAFSSPQPPGSTFKVITTTAALEAGVVKPDDQFPVVSSATVGGREIANANNELCGGSFVEAFAHSCNSVFAPLGPKIGSERLVGTAERFGFNSPPSLFNARAIAAVDPAESTLPPSIPTDLDLGVSAIGQGQVQATPLEMASAAQAIADGGVREPTALVTDGHLGPHTQPVRVSSAQVASTMRSLMIAVVNSGTGTAAALPGVQVAGKTGTAELGPKPLAPGQEPEPGQVPEQKIDAWFTGFAPAGDPKLVAAAMIVDAPGDGGTVAAPIVREVLAAGLGLG
jgi:cell division protein FtsI/penicillin-binding protein 2